MSLRSTRQALIWTACVAALALAAFAIIKAHQGVSTSVRWDMIDVNPGIQGDAHLLTGAANTVLIDAGHVSVSKTVLLPYLKQRKVARIDVAIVTHGHNDHYGGLLTLLDDTSISIGRIYMSRPPEAWVRREHWGASLAELDAIENKARERGIALLPLQEFDSIHVGGNYHLRALAAPTEQDFSSLGLKPDINDLSLIALLTNGQVSALFTGDLNKAYSNHLAKQTDTSAFRVDLLKFPHHGVEGFASDEFIKITGAKVFLKPMPPQFLEHPRGERARVLARAMNATVYSNGQHGHISVLLEDDRYAINVQRTAPEPQ